MTAWVKVAFGCGAPLVGGFFEGLLPAEGTLCLDVGRPSAREVDRDVVDGVVGLEPDRGDVCLFGRDAKALKRKACEPASDRVRGDSATIFSATFTG